MLACTRTSACTHKRISTVPDLMRCRWIAAAPRLSASWATWMSRLSFATTLPTFPTLSSPVCNSRHGESSHRLTC